MKLSVLWKEAVQQGLVLLLCESWCPLHSTYHCRSQRMQRQQQWRQAVHRPFPDLETTVERHSIIRYRFTRPLIEELTEQLGPHMLPGCPYPSVVTSKGPLAVVR
ncbi:uncharacterized protein LOC144827341 isoform X2 [Lissotriton helveticus]